MQTGATGSPKILACLSVSGHFGISLLPKQPWSRTVDQRSCPEPLREGERQRRPDRIAQQVERGELVIRQASDAEREQWARERQERERREQAKS